MYSLKQLIKNDLYRHCGNNKMKSFFKFYFLSPGFNFMVWYRIVNRSRNPILKYLLFRKSIKYGIQIPVGVDIGQGFYIGHWGGDCD